MKTDKLATRPEHWRYHLGITKKINCPVCGGSKKFDCYFDKHTGEVMESFGRCDRENSCGAHIKPWEDENHRPIFERRKQQPKPVYNYPTVRDMIEMYKEGDKLKAKETKFIKWLYTLGYKNEALERLIQRYRLGRKQGGIVFPCYSYNKRLARFKRFWYKSNGKRTEYLSYLPKDGTFERGLFGFQHVTRDETVYIVESEKSACLGFLEYYERHGVVSTWVATGGANGLTAGFVKELKGCTVKLIPDCDNAGRGAFLKIFAKLADICEVDYIELNEKRTDGYDLADKIVRLKQNGKEKK